MRVSRRLGYTRAQSGSFSERPMPPIKWWPPSQARSSVPLLRIDGSFFLCLRLPELLYVPIGILIWPFLITIRQHYDEKCLPVIYMVTDQITLVNTIQSNVLFMLQPSISDFWAIISNNANTSPATHPHFGFTQRSRLALTGSRLHLGLP